MLTYTPSYSRTRITKSWSGYVKVVRNGASRRILKLSFADKLI